MKEDKRMELNLDEMEMVTGGEESILDRISNQVKSIKDRIVKMIDSI